MVVHSSCYFVGGENVYAAIMAHLFLLMGDVVGNLVLIEDGFTALAFPDGLILLKCSTIRAQIVTLSPVMRMPLVALF